jgi:hypothetical protein
VTAECPIRRSSHPRALSVVAYIKFSPTRNIAGVWRDIETPRASLPTRSPTPIIDHPLWGAVQMRLAGNTAERNSGTRTHQSSLLAGMLFDAEVNRMTPKLCGQKGHALPLLCLPPADHLWTPPSRQGKTSGCHLSGL